jgi:biotin-(acetyl-CoA carboxylase) ligase
MAQNKLCKMNGIAVVVCRRQVGWKRSVDHFRQYGIASRIVQSIEFEDQESIHVIAAWHPFISGKHHKVRKIDSTNAEMLRGEYKVGDSFVATIQTDGRGRHGNYWQDHPDAFKTSWMLDAADLTSITPRKQLKLAQEIRSALCFEKEHQESMLTKWPNDLLLRCKQDSKWRKMGGILFQSFSKGNEQRLVVGIGINTTGQELQPGQASLDEIEIDKKPSELYTIINAVVASMFEKKEGIPNQDNEDSVDISSLLCECIYRNHSCFVTTVNQHTLTIVNQDGQPSEIDDDDQISWKNLHPQ